MNTSSKDIFKSLSEQLKDTYPEQEAKSLAFWLMEFYLGATRKDILANKEWANISSSGLKEAFQKVLIGVPIQQVTGWAPFYGRDFKVNSHVLIPRNETEELVHLIINENNISSPKILDIGTGSGCIPITLALEIPEAQVLSIDISHEALLVAQENSALFNTSVIFNQLDILTADIPHQDLDIVVSNPPYVRELEKADMHSNVLNYEPHLALFVKDDDPLVFYRAIAQKASSALKRGGSLYFEINEAFGEETKQVMVSLGYQDVKVFQDLNGKMRMAVGKWDG